MNNVRSRKALAAILLAVGVAVACGGDQTPTSSSESENIAESALKAASGPDASTDGNADAGVVPESSAAAAALAQERARCTTPTSQSELPSREAEAFTHAARGRLSPVIPSKIFARTRHKAQLHAPRDLSDAVELTDSTSGMHVEITLLGASRTQAEVADGFIVHRDANGPGAHTFPKGECGRL